MKREYIGVQSRTISHAEFVAMVQTHLDELGITWIQLRDSMRACGCCSALDQGGHDAHGDLWNFWARYCSESEMAP